MTTTKVVIATVSLLMVGLFVALYFALSAQEKACEAAGGHTESRTTTHWGIQPNGKQGQVTQTTVICLDENNHEIHDY